eukprot:g17124.t1
MEAEDLRQQLAKAQAALEQSQSSHAELQQRINDMETELFKAKNEVVELSKSKTTAIEELRQRMNLRQMTRFHVTLKGPCSVEADVEVGFGLFGKQRSPKLSRSQLRKLCIKRAVHVVVIALNYIHNGMRPISVSLLGRRPTLAQLSVFRRLRALITACDLPGGQYPLPPGRSGFEFIARIVELEKFSAAHPAFNFDYGTSDHDEPKLEEKVGTIEEEHQFIINEKFSPLQPYRALDASRLKLSGKGQWDMQKYISSVLWLPFQDPGILCHGYPLGTDGPSFARESREENLKLAKLWDSRAESFKVIGAEVLADARTRSAGIVSVAAPLSKRVPMMMLSLRTAALPFISRTLASRLAGNWISVLTYRRCLCCLLSNLFSYGTKAAADGSDVLPMPRRVAEELVLASIFGLCAATDISVPYDNYIYATDASNAKGAVTLREVGPEISEILWLGGDKKGAYTMLDAPARATLRSLGEDCDGEPAIADFSDGPAKALPFEFDFVEIFGGSGVLSKAVVQMGFSSCTPIDLSNSPHHDIGNYKLVDWIFQMIKEKRFRSLACEPPCTTFSPAQHPASRSYRCPLGFDRKEPKTYLGNLLAFRSFAILWFAWRKVEISSS